MARVVIWVLAAVVLGGLGIALTGQFPDVTGGLANGLATAQMIALAAVWVAWPLVAQLLGGRRRAPARSGAVGGLLFAYVILAGIALLRLPVAGPRVAVVLLWCGFVLVVSVLAFVASFGPEED